MYLMKQQVQLSKLQTNINRHRFLKIVIIVCVFFDCFSNLTFETIATYFCSSMNALKWTFYFTKILVIAILCAMIFISLLLNLVVLLQVNACIYLIYGIGMFLYVIIDELRDGKAQEIKPPAYFTFFIYIIIILTIISGVFRLLGGIFSMIIVTVMKKIALIEEELDLKSCLVSQKKKSAKSMALSHDKNISSVHSLQKDTKIRCKTAEVSHTITSQQKERSPLIKVTLNVNALEKDIQNNNLIPPHWESRNIEDEGSIQSGMMKTP